MIGESPEAALSLPPRAGARQAWYSVGSPLNWAHASVMDPPPPDELPMEESEDVESLPLRVESLPGGDESDPEVVVPLPNDEESSDEVSSEEESPPKGQAVASDEVQLLLAMVKGIRGRRARRTAGLERYIFTGGAIGLSANLNNWLHLSFVYVVAVVSNGV